MSARTLLPALRNPRIWLQRAQSLPPLPPVMLLAPLLALIGIGFLLPLCQFLWRSIDGTELDPGRYLVVVTEPVYRDVLARSFTTGFGVTSLCLVLGFPLAYLLTILPRRIMTLLVICLLVPLFTAFLIRTYGWMSLLGRQGLINTILLALEFTDRPIRLLGTRIAVLIGMVHVLLPIAVFTLYATIARIDRRLLQAALVLGAHPVQAFLRVYLPLSLPGVIAAGILVFIMAIGFFIAPALLGGPADTMVAQLIVTQITTLNAPELGYALAGMLLLATLGILLLANLVVPLEQMWAPAGLADQRRMRRSLKPLARIAPVLTLLERILSRLCPPALVTIGLRLYAVAAVVFLLAPLGIVLLLSFSDSAFLVFPPPGYSLRWYRAFLVDPDWRSALVMSLELAAMVASLATVMGLSAALVLVRSTLPFKRPLFLVILSPLLVPVVIVALCLYVALGDLGLIGRFSGLVVGHLLIAAPYALVVLLGAVRGLDRSLERAAATLGAPPPTVLRRILVPLLAPGLISAWIMAFLHSFDELLVTLFLLGRQPQTLPLKMWSDIRMQFDPVISAASSSIIAMVAVIILAAQWQQARAQRRAGLRADGKAAGSMGQAA